jgi:hypothetical protein
MDEWMFVANKQLKIQFLFMLAHYVNVTTYSIDLDQKPRLF